MSFNVDAVTLTLIALLAAMLVGIFSYVAVAKAKARRAKRDKAAIRAAIIDYFRRSGVQVSVDCTSLGTDGRFTLVVESEPMKRFRLSHIIEMTLREHVRKTCGLELDKVYWRFPIKEAEQSAVMATAAGAAAGTAPATAPGSVAPGQQKPEETSDEYINEGLENYRHIPKPEVTELPWETFEQMATFERDKDGRQGNP
jgi:hypothetical protein